MIVSLFTPHKKFKKAKKNHNYGYMISARNESAVIGNLIDSIYAQDYPKELMKVFVVADNCTDNTGEVAKQNGAYVMDVTVPVKCKGDALKFAFGKLKKKDYDAYLVFDADNVVHPDFLKHMNNIYQSGYIFFYLIDCRNKPA